MTHDHHRCNCAPAKQRPNHILHLLLSVLTLGFWIPIWILVELVYEIEVFFAKKP